MNNRQAELFHYALEQIEKKYKELIISNLNRRVIEIAELDLNDLKHVVSVLNNYYGTVNRDDMKWIAEWFEGDNFDRLRECNDYTGICTDEELEDLIYELRNIAN